MKNLTNPEFLTLLFASVSAVLIILSDFLFHKKNLYTLIVSVAFAIVSIITTAAVSIMTATNFSPSTMVFLSSFLFAMATMCSVAICGIHISHEDEVVVEKKRKKATKMYYIFILLGIVIYIIEFLD